MRLLEQGTSFFERAGRIKVRFFWLKDLIYDGEIILMYVSFEELVADMITIKRLREQRLSTCGASFWA